MAGPDALLRFDSSAFNPIGGIKFALGITVAAVVSGVFDLDMLVVGIASLLTWLTDVPGPRRNRLYGMAAFGVIGVGLIWLASLVVDSSVWFPLTLAAVTFVLTMPLTVSQRGYQVGWSAILLFFSIAAFTGVDSVVQTELSIDLLIGVGLVMALTAIWPHGIGPYGRSESDTREPPGMADTQFVAVYAATVAVVMGVALYLGMQSFTAGAVWAANGAFFIIGPSTNQSIIHGLERAIAVIVGVAGGALAVEWMTADWLLITLWLILGAIALATLNAGYFIMVAAYTAGMTMTWAVQGQDIAAINSTERILAEFGALALALAAVAFLQWWGSHRQVDQHIETEIAS
ncbi:MAG: FUSC family protein [Acidimicrobiia bacterium]